MLFEFTADRIYDCFISLSLNSNTYKIVSRLYLTRDSVFFFFFQLVKDYYKDNKVEEHFKYDHTILESIQNDPWLDFQNRQIKENLSPTG